MIFSRTLAGLAAVVLAAAAHAADRPNVVFLLADDLGCADCGFMGGSEIKTPHIDKLAAAGARLDAFYVQPVCSPTRAALMTGRYPMRHGLQVGVVRPWAQYGLPLDERTLPQALKEAGYATAIVGKWHLGHFQPDYLPTRRGFDHQYGHYNGALDYFTHVRDGGFDWHRDDKVCRDEGYSTHLIASEAVAARRRARPAKKPLFLYVPFNAVHAPHQVPGQVQGAVREAEGRAADLRRDARRDGRGGRADRRGGRASRACARTRCSSSPATTAARSPGGSPTTASPGRQGRRSTRAACASPRSPPGTGTSSPAATVNEPLHMVDWYPTLLKLAGATLEQKLPARRPRRLADDRRGQAVARTRTILLNATPTGGGDPRRRLEARASNGGRTTRTATPAPKKKAGPAGAVELFNLDRRPVREDEPRRRRTRTR